MSSCPSQAWDAHARSEEAAAWGQGREEIAALIAAGYQPSSDEVDTWVEYAKCPYCGERKFEVVYETQATELFSHPEGWDAPELDLSTRGDTVKVYCDNCDRVLWRPGEALPEDSLAE